MARVGKNDNVFFCIPIRLVRVRLVVRFGLHRTTAAAESLEAPASHPCRGCVDHAITVVITC
jgi:hypothetical protein